MDLKKNQTFLSILFTFNFVIYEGDHIIWKARVKPYEVLSFIFGKRFRAQPLSLAEESVQKQIV